MKNATRGDLIVIHLVSHTFGIGIPSAESDNYHLGVVTNITRDGQPKKWRSVHGDAPRELTCYVGYQRHWIVPAADIDVEAAMDAANKHHWPQHESPMPYASLAEVKDALKPFKKS